VVTVVVALCVPAFRSLDTIDVTVEAKEG